MEDEHYQEEPAGDPSLVAALLNANAAVLDGQESGEALRLIVAELQSLGFDRVRLYMLSADGQVLRAAAQAGMGADFEGSEWRFADDGGLLSAVLESHAPRLVNRALAAAPTFEDGFEGAPPTERAFVSLYNRGRAVGLISVDNLTSRRAIGEAELRLLSLFASRAQTVIEGGAHESAERRAEGLESILQIYSAISSSLDSEQTLQTACRAAAQMTGADHSGLVIFEEGLERGVVRAEYPDLGLIGLEIPLRGVRAEEGLVNDLEPIVVGDVGAEKSLGPVGDILVRCGIRSALIVPVVGKGGALGSFSLDTLRSQRSFTDEEVRLCKMFAAQVAVAIENARLYEEERLWSRRLDELRRATLEITSQLDRAELLRTIVEKAVVLLGGEGGGVYEHDAGRQELTVAADYTRPDLVGKTQAEVATADPSGAALEVPLKWRDEVLSVLYVRAGAGRAFTPMDERLLRLFGDQVAVALVNVRLAASDAAKLKKMGLLSSAAGEFLNDLASQGLDERLEMIARRATEILEAEVCGIFLVKEEGWLSLEASYGHAEGGFTKGLRLPIRDETKGGLSGFIASQKELFNGYGERLVNHPNASRLGSPFTPSGKCTSLIAIPLTKGAGGEEKVIGLIRVSNKKSDEGEPLPSLRFTEEDEWILRILAEAVVIAIDNAELVEHLRRQRDDLSSQKESLSKMEEKLNLLLEAGKVVAQADSLGEGLQNLSEMVVSLLSNTFCRVLLLDEGGTSLQAKAAFPLDRGVLDWEPGLEARTPLAKYEGLREFLKAGEPRVVSWEDPEVRHYLEDFSEVLALRRPVRSLLMVPLKFEDEVVGLLDVGEIRPERADFDEEMIGLATGIASQIVTLVRRLAHYERRRALLIRLDDAARGIMGKYDLSKIYQETVTLAAGLVNYTGAALFVNRPQRQSLELCAKFGLDLESGLSVPYGAGLLAEAARGGKTVVARHYPESPLREAALDGCALHTALAVPLRQAGEVRAVLLVGDRADRHVSLEAEREVLERFAEQALVALQTSALVSREKLAVRHLEVLHRISYYVMSAKKVSFVVSAVLTGVTAGYGLGFNRAALFLLDDMGENLVGRHGVGDLLREEAVKSWERDRARGLYDLNAYLRTLEEGAEPTTPVGELIAGLCLPVGRDSDDLFSRTINDGKGVVVSDDFGKLPAAFTKALEPTTPVIVVPLNARGRAIGLLVADNKFTQAPINDDDVDALMTFANTAAMAVENIRLLKRLERGREKLRLLFTASTALSTSREPRVVLEEIVEQTRVAAEAQSVAIILSDELGRSRTLITKDGGEADKDIPPPDDDEVGFRVMQSGDYQFYEQCGQPPHAIGGGLVHCSRLCMPLSLHGESFGWMWINYGQLRTFSEFEIDAIQLYVNHAAVAYDSARRMDALNHMRRAAEAMAGAADIKGMLEQIVRSARVTLQADSAAIWTYDAVRNNFVEDGWVASNISPELRGRFWSDRPGEGGTAYTVMERGWVCVEDVRDAETYPFIGEKTRSLLGPIGVQSFIGVSLSVGAEPLGVLYVNFSRPRQFRPEEQETARTFANHAALALKKARLLEQVTKTKKAAEAVARVTVLGKRADTLYSIVEETRRALDCDIVTLYEYDKQTRTLLHPPTMVGLSEEGRRKVVEKGGVDKDSIVYLIQEKDEPYIVERVSEDLMFGNRQFARDEGIQSCVAIPLRMAEQKLGVMFVNYRTPRRFMPDELGNMALFSNQAAVAIFNAQLYDARNAQLIQQRQLLNLSHELLGIARLQETLDEATRLAANILAADFCAIVLPDGDGGLWVEAAHGWPEEMVGREKLQQDLGSQSGFTIKSGVPVVVEDYSREYRFTVPPFVRAQGIVSGASVPMFAPGESNETEPVGVMLVHSKSQRRFGEEEQGLLSLVAGATAIAIQRTRQYEELKSARGRIGARTALVWMGMVNNYYQHTIVGHGSKIKSSIELLRRFEKTMPPEEQLPAWVGAFLEEINDSATQIVERPVTPPLSSEEGVADVNVCQLLAERLAQLWALEKYEQVRLVNRPDPTDSIVVRISPEWLRRALDILVDNAIHELMQVVPARRELAVTARAGWREVEILVTDRGRGFPQKIADKIFKGKIEKQTDAKGLGMGLLMAQAIVETYGGRLDIESTGPEGTSMGIWLPLGDRPARSGGREI